MTQARHLNPFAWTWSITLVLALGIMLFSLATAQATTGRVIGATVTEHPDWFKDSFLDLTEDVAEAAEADKHLILIMDMEGCPYCHKMIEENFAHAPYRDFIQEHFDVIALNIRGSLMVDVTEDLSLTERELAEHLNVRFTPTVVFLDANHEQVARVNGYRNVEDFQIVLEYVQERAYRIMSLNEYAQARQNPDVYAFRDHPNLVDLDDLSRVTDRPLAVLFEDGACVACEALHDGHLADAEIRAILDDLVLVRVDTRSDDALVTPDGRTMTASEFANELGIQYRPSLVMFDQGEEVVRIESMLYRFHFGGILDFVAGRHFERYPGRPFAYINEKTDRILATGDNVVIVD